MSRLSDEREAELEIWRAIERDNWRCADECGTPRSEDERIWDMLNLEMDFYCSDQGAKMAVPWLVSEWVRTGRKNPYLVDAAIIRLQEAGCGVPPAMWPEIAAAAQYRFEGRRPVGTPSKIERESVHSRAYRLMVQALLCDYSLERAAGVAAVWLEQNFPRFALKASTLAYNYSKEWRTPEASGLSREQNELRRWTHPAAADARKAMAQLIASLPEPSDEMKGVRR